MVMVWFYVSLGVLAIVGYPFLVGPRYLPKKPRRNAPVAIGYDPLAAEVCRSCRKHIGRHEAVYRETRAGGGRLCAGCAVSGYGAGIVTLDRAAPTAIAIGYDAVALEGPWRPSIVAPAPVQPREDTSWMDVVGIPFELWCSVGRCHGPSGYELGAMVAYLVGRRDAGDFREPVDLVKRYRRLPAKVEKPDPYSFCAPVGSSEPLEIAMQRSQAQQMMSMGIPTPQLLQGEVFRGSAAHRARYEWIRQHMHLYSTPSSGRLAIDRWPERAECWDCQEEMITRREGDQWAVLVKRMVPSPNPGLGGRR